MAEPKIDTIKMTQTIRDKNYERLRNLSREERLAFYREQALRMNAKAAILNKNEARKQLQS